jgi:hypothetical protein
VFSVAQQVAQDFDFRLIRNAHQRGIESRERDFIHLAILRLAVYRIHGGYVISAAELPTLVALDAEPHYDDSHLEPVKCER